MGASKPEQSVMTRMRICCRQLGTPAAQRPACSAYTQALEAAAGRKSCAAVSEAFSAASESMAASWETCACIRLHFSTPRQADSSCTSCGQTRKESLECCHNGSDLDAVTRAEASEKPCDPFVLLESPAHPLNPTLQAATPQISDSASEALPISPTWACCGARAGSGGATIGPCATPSAGPGHRPQMPTTCRTCCCSAGPLVPASLHAQLP
jgi:hypothetical protein